MSSPAVDASLSAVCEKMDAFYSPDARAQLVASTISLLTSQAAMAIAWVLLGYWLALLPKIMEVIISKAQLVRNIPHCMSSKWPAPVEPISHL